MYSSLDVIKQQFSTELSDMYTERESTSLFYRMTEYVTGLKKVDVVLNPKAEITPDHHNEMVAILNRLKLGEPSQYIDNIAYFLDSSFYVDESVLIPRPETEELVRLILKNHEHGPLKVLDIGTGSGIISISLSKQRPEWIVLACDISNDALVTARRNGREILNQSEVAFYKEDILTPQTQYSRGLDVIVSNPPYVLESDKKEMQAQILNHEPHLALFVPNENALLFYESILNYANKNLKADGYLYFEVHEGYANEVSKLLTRSGYNDVSIHQDLQGKSRFVCGKRG